ncbi:hypothetical protein NPIL_308771 [Nephila pilipes]|nr:hypothetical protein NPIL_308771 [Nephila pilipes]
MLPEGCSTELIQTFVLVTRWNFKIPHFKDQRYSIKFCIALKKTGAKTVAMQRKVNGDNIVPKYGLPLAQDVPGGQRGR